MTDPAKAIRIGTMIKASEPGAAERMAKIADLGFESFEPFFWQTTNGQNLAELGKRSLEAIGNRDITISTIGVFGNPLEDKDADRTTLAAWKDAIDNAHHFGATCVAGFRPRVRGQPLPDSLPRYKEVWGELSKRAAGNGVRIAFENCSMDGNWATGDWNIAHNPDAWELMFNETPDDNLGLEWEPAHQLVYLIDPLPQIRKSGAQILPCARQGCNGCAGTSSRNTGSSARKSSYSCARRASATATGPTSSLNSGSPAGQARSTSKAGMTRSIAMRSK